MTFAEPSIKSLFLEIRFEGQVLASGSGFLVQSARHVFLVTNRHNVTSRTSTYFPLFRIDPFCHPTLLPRDTRFPRR